MKAKCELKIPRMSNFELLRIVAMMLVMLGHTHFRMYSFVQANAGIKGIFDTALACISTTGVGIFIVISGWFGIRPRKCGLVKYLFQIFFTLWVIYGIFIILGLDDFNADGVKISMSLYSGYWFVIGYLGLYIIAPILNKFIEYASKREYQMMLLSFYLFQSYYSWITAWYDYYMAYSVLLFSGIYLTAAYIRKYPIKWLEKYALHLFVIVILCMTSIATVSLYLFGHAARMIRDDNPLVIFEALLLVTIFGKIKFQSRFVNWLAASCFAVYLIHFHPLVYPYLFKIVADIYGKYDGIVYVVLLLTILILVYLCCTFLDQIRVLVWSILNKVYFKYVDNHERQRNTI